MLIICEDCAKKYNIDESRIKGNRARFTCKECGFIIIVEKSDITRRLISAPPFRVKQNGSGTVDLLREMEETADPSASREDMAERQAETSGQTAQSYKNSVPVLSYFLLALLAAFLSTSGVLAYLYIGYIADSLQKTGMHTHFLGRAILLLTLSWAIVLGAFLLIARLLTRSVTRLKE